MANGDSVTVSIRLNLNREEDMEIHRFLFGDVIKTCYGDKSKFIKSALFRTIQGIKRDENNNCLVCEMNTQREIVQNAMTGEADRIINAVKLIVKDEVKRLAEVQIEKKMSHDMSETMPEKMEETPEDFDETVSEYAMAFLSDF